MRPYIVLFGDSITQYSLSVELRGWGSLLADYYNAKVDIINRGFSGYTTRIAVLLLDKVFPLGQNSNNSSSILQPHPSLVTILFGANDAAAPPSPQHVPLDEYADNLRAIVAHVKKICNNIVLITPPPFEPERWDQFCAANQKPNISRRSNELVSQYAQKVLDIATETNVHCIDLYRTMKSDPDWEIFLVDGLHLSSEGNGFLFGKLRDLIQSQISEFSPAKLPLFNNEGIAWSEIDMENPRNSIKLP